MARGLGGLIWARGRGRSVARLHEAPSLGEVSVRWRGLHRLVKGLAITHLLQNKQPCSLLVLGVHFPSKAYANFFSKKRSEIKPCTYL